MITQAQDFEAIYSVPWFGSDGTVLTQQAIDDAPTQAEHLKIYSTYAAPAESEVFTTLYDKYYALVNQPFGYYSACAYDVGWILTSTILESQSTDAIDRIPLQTPTGYKHGELADGIGSMRMLTDTPATTRSGVMVTWVRDYRT